MKCDNCRFFWSEGAGMDYPYPWASCMKGHWDGGPIEDDQQPYIPDPWDNCQDFEHRPPGPCYSPDKNQ